LRSKRKDLRRRERRAAEETEIEKKAERKVKSKCGEI
jgi:hypothetical protein